MDRHYPDYLCDTLLRVFEKNEHNRLPSSDSITYICYQHHRTRQLMRGSFQGLVLQAVSNSLWAYAKLGYNPGILLLDVASQKAAGMLHQYTSQELANTVWAIAVLEHYPGANLLNSAAMQIARRIEQFSPQVDIQ